STHRPLFVEDGMALYTVDRTSTLVIHSKGATPRRVPTSRDIVVASSCGDRIIAAEYKAGQFDVVWLDDQGRIVGSVTRSGVGHYPTCNSDGSIIFYGSLGEHPGVERCDRAGCRMIFSGPVGTISVSPDDKRLAFTTIDNSGAAVRWMWSDGSGSVHVVTDTQNVCGPIWASNKNLWVSLRKGHQEVWTEIDTDRERSTGRTSPASNGCADGYPD